MADEPMIKLDSSAQAPILSYNIPESTSYSGRNFIELDLPADYFSVKRKIPPKKVDPAVGGGVAETLKNAGIWKFINERNPGIMASGTLPLSPKLAQLDIEEVMRALQAGQRLNVYRSMFGTLSYNYVSAPKESRPRIMLVETYRLSSYLGAYGAGRVIKTLSLFPGEKTRIRVRSYASREAEAKSASSILDSFTQESADEFQNSMQSEQSRNDTSSESSHYNVQAVAEASWGWWKSKVSGGLRGRTNSSREEFAKNVSNATQRHAAKASAKRDININTSYEVKEQTREETSIEREIQNVNLTSTLNLVFRQMNQEFVTLLHLVDVRVAFFDGTSETRSEVTLPELDSLLESCVIQDKRAEVRDLILGELQNVFDYTGTQVVVVEERALNDAGGNPVPGTKYPRFKRDLISEYKDPITGTNIPAAGVILSVTKSVLRTDGVTVETLLGKGEALDIYAKQLQEVEVKRRQAEADKIVADAARSQLINDLVDQNEAQKAKILADLTCPCGPLGIDKDGEEAPK